MNNLNKQAGRKIESEQQCEIYQISNKSTNKAKPRAKTSNIMIMITQWKNY